MHLGENSRSLFSSGKKFVAQSNLVALRALPLSYHRQIAQLAERAEACVDGATVHLAVTVDIQIPHARARAEYADPHGSGAIPISDNRQVAFCAKMSEALILLATIPFAVAVAIEVPRSPSGQENSDLLRTSAVPVAHDRQLADRAENRALVDFTTIQLAVPVDIEVPAAPLDDSTLPNRGNALWRKCSDNASLPVTQLTNDGEVSGLA